jgi:hypothetical protein
MPDNVRPFIYRGYRFTLQVEVTDAGFFRPTVAYYAERDAKPITLPPDADPYRTEAEAWRHAEQQAIRWVHDRTGMANFQV